MNIQFSTPVYIAGAIVGFVLIVVSLAVIIVRPADVAQYAQNSVTRAVVVAATPTPGIPVVGDYVVTVR